MKKKIGLIMSIVVLFVFVFSGVKNTYVANAEESNDFVIGTENLNNTPENSAKVGDQLKLPEKGWKRYDDTNKKINYLNMEQVQVSEDRAYKGTATRALDWNQKVAEIKFNFTGNKLRLIGSMWPNHSKEIFVYIDNVKYSYNPSIKEQFQSLNFEENDLKDKEHFVRIYCDNFGSDFDGVWFNLDAIDIDENRELLPYEVQAQSMTLDKTSMDLLEGSSDKLTATVLPEDATNKKVIWSSSDESIAKVDENGNITAIKEGQAIITAKVENTDLTATCKVKVTKLVEESKNNAILSISLVNGATKEYDVSMEEVEKFINWFEERSSGNGPSLYSFNKKISPYKSVKEYIVHDKIASFEVREYEATK